MSPSLRNYPVTPDGRYFVVSKRLWRCANPGLVESERDRLVKDLMDARKSLRGTISHSKLLALRAKIDAAKRALGERGHPWWTDGAPDYNRYLVKNTPYAEWFKSITPPKQRGGKDWTL